MSSTKFEKYVIYTTNYELNGTKEATIFLNPNTNTHNMFIRIESVHRYPTSTSRNTQFYQHNIEQILPRTGNGFLRQALHCGGKLSQALKTRTTRHLLKSIVNL